jgi:hypothetical protein
MKTLIKLGIYRHYKGQDYQVIGSARHSENEEALVLYHPLYGNESDREYWVRPLAMFTGTVSLNGREVPRFTPVSDPPYTDKKTP